MIDPATMVGLLVTADRSVSPLIAVHTQPVGIFTHVSLSLCLSLSLSLSWLDYSLIAERSMTITSGFNDLSSHQRGRDIIPRDWQQTKRTD